MPCRSSFSRLGVIFSGNEPITTRFEGFPPLDAFVTTTRFAFESGVAPDDLVLLSEGPTTIRCQKKEYTIVVVINTVRKAISRSTFFVLFPQTEVKVVTLKPVSRVTRGAQRVYYAGNFIGTVLIGSFIVIFDSVDATVTL